MKSYVMISMMNRLFEQLVKSKASEYEADTTSEYFKYNEGIHFCVKVDADCMGFANDDGNTQHQEWICRVIKHFHVIMLYPHKVFVCITDYKIRDIPQTGWTNTSNHNSCWRDGCRDLTSLGFECWDEAFAKVPKDKRPSTKDEGMDMSLDLSIMGGIFEFVSCDVEPDYETDESGYHKKISNIKRIQKTLTY